MTEKAILFDSSRCIACRGCQSACKQWNGLGSEQTHNSGSYENPPDLTSDTWVKIKFKELESNHSVDWIFTRQACMHCTDAACVSVCPSQALKHHRDGFVIYRKDRCTGCGYCVEACPFDVPRMSGSDITGIRKMDKCTFCSDRVDSGYEPSCVKTCPTGALLFGQREDLISKGKERINQIRSSYPDASLYGEKELAGLHVMYVLPYKPEVHGLPASPKISPTVGIHELTRWAGIGAASVGMLLIGLNFIATRTRQIELAKSESQGKGIQRYRKRTVWFHWLYAISFMTLLLTGMSLFVPGLGILAQNSILRVIHRGAAVIFTVAPITYFLFNPKTSLEFIKTSFSWNKNDLTSLKALGKYYFGGPKEDIPPQGFINSGQKAWQLLLIIAYVIFLVTGAEMGFRSTGDTSADQFGWMVIIHDFAFIASGLMLMVHIYLGSIHPRTRGAFGAMISGKVSGDYAKDNYRKWYDEITDSQDPR